MYNVKWVDQHIFNRKERPFVILQRMMQEYQDTTDVVMSLCASIEITKIKIKRAIWTGDQGYGLGPGLWTGTRAMDWDQGYGLGTRAMDWGPGDQGYMGWGPGLYGLGM